MKLVVGTGLEVRAQRAGLACYLIAMAGEQICLADRSAHRDLESLREDFWLVDDAMVVRMIYDAQGRFERPELVGDVRPYIGMRDTAFRHAEPLDEYVARRGLECTARSV